MPKNLKRIMKVKKPSTRTPAGSPIYMGGLGLLEVMLFLFIVGATLVVGYAWLAAKQQATRAEASAAQLQQANRYIDAFAAAKFRLPCPAPVNGNGIEDCSLAKGVLPYRTLRLDGSAAQKGVGQLQYIVNPTLTPAPSNLFEPHKWDRTQHDFKQISSADYCRRLIATNTTPLGAQVRNTTGVLRPVAYAIAHPGNGDADGDGTAFDGANGSPAAVMEAPQNTLIMGAYDDSVMARTTAELYFTSDCDVLLTTLDMLALGVDVTDEVQSAAIAATVTASVLTLIGGVKIGVTILKITLAGVALGAAITTLTGATGLLSAAIAGCAVLVGCAELPHAIATVAAAVAAVTAGGVAIAAGIASLVPALVYVGLTLTVAIMAGVSTSQTVDLTEAKQIARDSLAAATANRVAANAKLIEAQNNAAPTNNAQAAARTALFNEANNPSNGIIATTNALGVPAGTTPVNTLDGDIADAIVHLGYLNDAQYNEAAARSELKVAQQTVPEDPAVTANKQTLLDNAIAAVAFAQLGYNNRRQNLIAYSRRAYCVTTTSGNPAVTTTDCNLFYDGRSRMTARLNTFEAKFNEAYLNNKKLEGAQQTYNAAVATEAQAQASLNQLLNANTTPTAGTATQATVWAGAEAILKRADAMGGTKP